MENLLKRGYDMKKKLAEHPVLLCFLVALCPALLCSGLALLRSALENDAVILALSYVCRFLTLIIGFFGLGCSLRAACRADMKRATVYLAVSAAAYAVTQAIVSVPEILYINSIYPDDLGYTIFTNIAAALGNAIGFFLLFFAILFIAYLSLLRGKKLPTGELPFFSRRDRRTLAAALATLLLFLYQFIPQLINTLADLIDEFGPTFTQADIFYLVLEAAFLICSMLLGYITLGIVQGYVKE